MRASQRAFFKRGGAACAAAAVLLGGTFAASAATAAPTTDATPSSISTTVAKPSANEAALPAGLDKATKQDLGKTVEEFNADAEVAAKAAEVQAAVATTDPTAVVSVKGDTINVTTTAPEAAKAAAGTSKVVVTKIQAVPLSVAKGAASVDSLFAAYTAEFGVTELQAIMVDADGNYVIRTGKAATSSSASPARFYSAPATKSVADFAATFTNVAVETAAGAAKAFATDLTNGQGYVSQQGDYLFSCSIGWNGFNAAGDPAVISAGHCTNDGAATNTALTDPTKEPAVGGAGYVPTVALGTFGGSQFGGANNSPATAPSGWDGNPDNVNNIGTDVSVIDGINPDLNQLAKVTDWTTPAVPKESGPVVKGVSNAIVGAEICKSGRTTGWSCGTVSRVGVFLVNGINQASDPEDVRAVRGFESTSLTADHGDSGGAIISGSLAVGMLSAGGGGYTYGVGLTDALAHTAGYTIKIALSAPEVTTTAPVHRKDPVSGTVADAPDGTTVTVTLDGKTSEVAVDGAGKWSVEAPNNIGTFPITVQAKNGFSTSATTTASVDVMQETLAAPAISAPANNATVIAPVTVISGTGTASATVALSGDVTGTAAVDAAGEWSFTVAPGLAVGSHTVTAKQTLAGWNDSTSVTTTFKAIPVAPAVTSPTQGQEFAFNEGPSVISGTNIDGAMVTVTVNGKSYDALVIGGKWSVNLGAKLTTGDYTITVAQSLSGVSSSKASFEFKVLAEVTPEPTTPPATPTQTTTPSKAPTTAPATKTPTKAPSSAAAPAPTKAPATKAPKDDELANTGASSSTLVFGAAGALLVLGGATFLLLRRRSAR